MFGIHRNFPAGGGADVNDYLAYRMNFGSTAAMTIASEDWSFSSGVTVVGTFTKTAHLNAGGFNRLLFDGRGSASGQINLGTVSSDVAQPTQQQRFTVFINDASAVNLVQVYSSTQITDAALHNFLFSYNPATAAAYMYIDDASEINAAAAGHTLATGTLPSGAAAKIFGRLTGPVRFWGETGGSCGYFGIANTFIDFSVQANRRKFFDAAGLPVKPDESTWSQWGGVTPYCWHPAGDLRNNRGSKSDFTDDSTTAANLIAVV